MNQSKPQFKRVKRNISGWLILDKPYDMSSTEAVGKLRWLLSAKKAGHAGTLDPLATGILPIAFGEATKTVPMVQDGTKVYRFALKWGSATTTDDGEGEVTQTSDARPTKEQVLVRLPAFTGLITQIPPVFSAIKINGQRAYDLARAGEKVSMPSREVEIDSFTLLSHTENVSEFEVQCAKGTYIRALARDLAEALGTCGHVSMLHRAAVGQFGQDRAITIDMIEAATLEERDAFLMPVSEGLRDLPEVRVDASQAQRIRSGNPVLLVGADAPIALDDAWASLKGAAVAIGYVDKGQFHPRRVIL